MRAMNDRRKIPAVRPLFANAGLVQRLFGLTCSDLRALRKAGTVFARKATEKRWLYRVADIAKYMETLPDGVVRDKEYEEDLAYVEEKIAEFDAEAQAEREADYDRRHGLPRRLDDGE